MGKGKTGNSLYGVMREGQGEQAWRRDGTTTEVQGEKGER